MLLILLRVLLLRLLLFAARTTSVPVDPVPLGRRATGGSKYTTPEYYLGLLLE